MDSFTLAVVCGMIVIMLMLAGLVVIDKGAPGPGKSRDKQV